MRTFDKKVPVGDLLTAVTVCLPDEVPDTARVWFGFPGGGFGRRYYDIQTLPGYSQAEYHTGRGDVFVACDHLGVGDSSMPEDSLSVSYEQLAEANHATALDILDRLQKGTLDPTVPRISVTAAVGMGQSMGGCLLTVQQAKFRTFDAVALLGWSGIHTNFPSPDGSRITYPMPPRGTDLAPIADQLLGVVAPNEEQFKFCFHYPDEDPRLAEADLASYKPYSGAVRGDARTPWGSSTTPPCAVTMMTEGAVAADAAAIDVPVFIGCGERDVVPDPWAEPAAYPRSSYITVSVLPSMAHMHNFARTREKLWHRISTFGDGVGCPRLL